MVYLIFGLLFLAGAIFNIFDRNYVELGGCVFFSLAMFGIHFSRKNRQKPPEGNQLLSMQWQPCSKCGSVGNVKMRAYMICYSLILFTSKSHGRFKPVCDSCKTTAGLRHSLITVLLGWWGFPWGPIYTVQCLIRNSKGGVALEETQGDTAKPIEHER